MSRMDAAPECRVHSRPMRKSDNGEGYFCPSKVGEGWCDQTAEDPATGAAIEARRATETTALESEAERRRRLAAEPVAAMATFADVMRVFEGGSQ